MARSPTLAPVHPGVRRSAAAPRAAGHPRQDELDRIDRFADLMDSRFSIFGVRFGLEGIVGLVPGLGDLATLGPSAWLVWEGWRMGASRRTLGRMAGNVGLDFLVGAVPLAGDVFDVLFKANRRNARLLREDIERSARPGG
ncbi:uncharacterized protein DUF4112 [Hasllibacter halocynthiae]|uniref:Uncharacterized protein DUF4112 n=1 Tax=Hasllibacter halocynthiae TaxID=595589 RepID=A0A2T0X472_9RHOB|nr:DUF4112 domain-containing protein [Hasllibacter halocynthiae]PRY93740.1 uncharacterized protein DUF4112 [Hasllibacter halocynthiae]